MSVPACSMMMTMMTMPLACCPRSSHTPSCPLSQRHSQDSCCRRRRPAPPCICLSPHNSQTRSQGNQRRHDVHSRQRTGTMACRAAVHAAAQGPALTCLAGRAVAGAYSRGGALGGARDAAAGARVEIDAVALVITSCLKRAAVRGVGPTRATVPTRATGPTRARGGPTTNFKVRVVPGADRLVPPVADAICHSPRWRHQIWAAPAHP